MITAQMSETIEYVVTKRQKNFDYIKRAHQGKIHWLNVIKLSKSQILKYYTPSKLQKRVERWFMLGMSVGKFLEFSSGALVVRSLTQLLEEYEHYVSHGKPQKRAWVPPVAEKQYQPSEPVKPVLLKMKRHVVYEYLQTPQMCMDEGHLDYCEVVYSLCEVMSFVYNKFLDGTCSPPHIHEAILKCDKKIKTMIIGKMASDLTNIALPLMKVQLQELLSHMFIDQSKSNPVQQKYINLTEDDDIAEHAEDDVNTISISNQSITSSSPSVPSPSSTSSFSLSSSSSSQTISRGNSNLGGPSNTISSTLSTYSTSTLSRTRSASVTQGQQKGTN